MDSLSFLFSKQTLGFTLSLHNGQNCASAHCKNVLVCFDILFQNERTNTKDAITPKLDVIFTLQFSHFWFCICGSDRLANLVKGRGALPNKLKRECNQTLRKCFPDHFEWGGILNFAVVYSFALWTWTFYDCIKWSEEVCFQRLFETQGSLKNLVVLRAEPKTLISLKNSRRK